MTGKMTIINLPTATPRALQIRDQQYGYEETDNFKSKHGLLKNYSREKPYRKNRPNPD